MIKIIACGKVKEKWMKDGIAEYVKRIRPYEMRKHQRQIPLLKMNK